MEMVCDFTMQPGLSFSFTGDDDVWVFINGRLAVDVGGIHSAVTASVDLDASRRMLGNLIDGRKYTLHMFYAERHTTESNIKITTNIISSPVGVKIKVDGYPMKAGEPKLVASLVQGGPANRYPLEKVGLLGRRKIPPPKKTEPPLQGKILPLRLKAETSSSPHGLYPASKFTIPGPNSFQSVAPAPLGGG
ncbi:hypothetical protein R80B4_02592 [Fibrobacteres bacterium R8-0-B4]